MAMKAAAVWWLVTGDTGDRASLYQMLDALDRYHGQPNGIFSADEHYAGRDPSQGTELCAVVEAMFSLETDISILGDAAFGDRLEKIAYNALPATLSAGPVGASIRSAGQPDDVHHLQPPLGHQRSGDRTSSGWSRTSAAAPRTCTRAGRSWPRICGWRRRTTASPPWCTAPAK